MQRLKNIGFCRVFTRFFLVILSLFCINWRVLHVDKTLPLGARARARARARASHASLSLILSPWRHRRCAKPVNFLSHSDKTDIQNGKPWTLILTPSSNRLTARLHMLKLAFQRHPNFRLQWVLLPKEELFLSAVSWLHPKHSCKIVRLGEKTRQEEPSMA